MKINIMLARRISGTSSYGNHPVGYWPDIRIGHTDTRNISVQIVDTFD